MKMSKKMIVVTAIIAMITFLLPIVASAATVQMDVVTNQKNMLVNCMQENMKVTNEVLDVTETLIANDMFIRSLGIATGSATTAFTTALSSVATDTDNLLNAGTLLTAKYYAERAQYHADAAMHNYSGTMTDAKANAILMNLQEQAYCCEMSWQLAKSYVDEYAEVAKQSTSKKYQHLYNKFFSGAFDGALAGYGNDAKTIMKAVKTVYESSGNLEDAFEKLASFSSAYKEAKKVKDDWQVNVIDKANRAEQLRQENIMGNPDNYEFYSTLKLNDNSIAVKRLCIWLNKTMPMSSNLNTNSTVFTKEVEDILKQFQELRDLPVTGEVDATTHEKLQLSYRAMQMIPLNTNVNIVNPQMNGRYVLDAAGEDWGKNGGRIQLWERIINPIQKKHYNQVFQVKPVTDGSLIIVSEYQNKVLEIGGGRTNDEATANTWDIHNALYSINSHMRWYVELNPKTGYINFINCKSQKALDISGNDLKNGQTIQQYSQNDTSAQDWTLWQV